MRPGRRAHHPYYCGPPGLQRHLFTLCDCVAGAGWCAVSGFVYSVGLSKSPGVAAVAKEFALAGYARYVLILEALAAETAPVCLSYDGWADRLYSDDESVREYMQFCQDQGLLVIEDDGERLTVHSPDLQRVIPTNQAPNDDTLYTRPEQWSEWFVNDLAYPLKTANSADNRRYFARWCASRVTVGDMCAAVEAAIAQGSGVSVTALHQHLQALRAKRLQEAAECY